MRIRTHGSHNTLTPDLCRRAIRFYGKKLLTKKQYHSISVTVEFDDELRRTRELAYCFAPHRGRSRPRSFILGVCPTLSEKDALISLAHEMVHVHQYVSGKLFDYSGDRTSVRWLGERYTRDEWNPEDYFLSPWELEARGYEYGLYCLFRMQGVDSPGRSRYNRS